MYFFFESHATVEAHLLSNMFEEMWSLVTVEAYLLSYMFGLNNILLAMNYIVYCNTMS